MIEEYANTIAPAPFNMFKGSPTTVNMLSFGSTVPNLS